MRRSNSDLSKDRQLTPWKPEMFPLSRIGNITDHLIKSHILGAHVQAHPVVGPWKRPSCQIRLGYNQQDFFFKPSWNCLTTQKQQLRPAVVAEQPLLVCFTSPHLSQSHSWVPGCDDVIHRDSEKAVFVLFQILSVTSKGTNFSTHTLPPTEDHQALLGRITVSVT